MFNKTFFNLLSAIVLPTLYLLGLGPIANASSPSSSRMCSQVFSSNQLTAAEKYADLTNKIVQLSKHEHGSKELAVLSQEILDKVKNALNENGIAYKLRGTTFRILPIKNDNPINKEVLDLWNKNPRIKVLYRPLLNEYASYEAAKNELTLSVDALIYNRPTSFLVHEGRHADLHSLFLQGKNSIFHGFMFANSKIEFSENPGYKKQFTFEELSTFAIDTAFEIQALRKKQNTMSADDVMYYARVLNSLARATVQNILEFKKPLLSVKKDTASWKITSWEQEGDTQPNATYWGFEKNKALVTFTSDSHYGPRAVKIWIKAFSGNQIMLSAQRAQFNSFAYLRNLFKKPASQNLNLEELPSELVTYLDYFDQRIDALNLRAQQIQSVTDAMLNLYFTGYKEAAFDKATELEILGYDEIHRNIDSISL